MQVVNCRACARRALITCRGVGKARQLHLTSQQSVDLLRDYGLSVADSASTSTSTKIGINFRVFPSRAVHKPVLHAQNGRKEATLEFDINSDEVDYSKYVQFAQKTGIDADGYETVSALYKAFRSNDASRISGNLSWRDGKAEISSPDIHIDPFAMYRQAKLAELAKTEKMHPLETQAAAGKLFYVKHEGGNIGCFGYGAGNGMATLDVLATKGGKSCNFGDGGGGATKENVQAFLNVLASDAEIDVIFINAFGGLTKTELIAQGMVDFAREQEKAGRQLPPIIARLRGTGEAEAAAILSAPGSPSYIKAVQDLEEAAEVVSAYSRKN